MKAIRADKMVLDYRIYPRTRIDPECVQMMEMAFRAGTKFPPVLIDNKSHRVIDGFHRITMFRRIDAAYPIEAVERQYADEAHMFADAVRLNANHGKNLSIWNRKHCLRRGAELGIEVKTLAAALSMTVEVAGELLPAALKLPGEFRETAAAERIVLKAVLRFRIRKIRPGTRAT